MFVAVVVVCVAGLLGVVLAGGSILPASLVAVVVCLLVVSGVCRCRCRCCFDLQTPAGL